MNKNANEPSTSSPPDGTRPAGPKGLEPTPGQALCGDLDMRIDRDGVWYYHGSPIGRKELVRLFSSVLRRDQAGDYWLVTPAEIGRVEVEDAPFLAVELTITGKGRERVISLRTNVGQIVAVDDDHPIRVDFDPSTGEPRPYVVMDGGVEARIARPVYYELVALGTEVEVGGETVFGIESAGSFFAIGKLDGGP